MRLSFLHHQQYIGARIINWIGILVLAGVGFFVLNGNFLLTPTMSFTYHVGGGGRVIAPISPASLVRTADPKIPWRLASDALPFHVLIPRLISAVRVGATVNPGTANYIALRAQGQQGADLSTIVYSQFLNTLDWPHTTHDGLTIWSRPESTVNGKTRSIPVYTTLDDLRQHISDSGTVAVAGLQPLSILQVKNYTPSNTPTVLDHALRGSHQLYVYAANEQLRIEFDKSDLNRIEGPDSLTVRVARADAMVGDSRLWLRTVVVPDDGTTSTSGPNGQRQHVNLSIDQVPAGVYVIDIVTNDDVQLSHLTLAQHVAAFNGRLYLAEGQAYGKEPIHPLDLITNGSEITFALYHEQSKQDITVGGKVYPLRDVRVDHVVSALRGTTTIHVPIGDGLFTSDGLISIAPAQLLPGRLPTKVNLLSTPKLDGIDYLVAAYTPLSPTTNRVTIDHEYSLNELGLQGKTLTFSILVPDSQSVGATVGVSELRTTWIRGPFPWNKIWSKIKR